MGPVVSIGVLPAILRVTDDRVADGAEVRTDLVRLTGDEVDLQYRVRRAALQRFVPGMDFDGVRERLRAVLARYDLPTKIEASPAALLPLCGSLRRAAGRRAE